MEKEKDEKREDLKKKHDILEGSIIKPLIALIFPIMIGNLLQTGYQLTDAFWVGRLGADAVASVSLSFPIIFLIISLSGGIGLAGSVFVSQYKGKKEQNIVDHVTGQTFLMAFAVSIIFSIIGYIFIPQIIKLFGAETSVFLNAVSYLRISFLGMIFIFGYMVFQSLSRGAGDAKTPVYIILGTVLLNFILDPLFIFGYGFIPSLGVGGAAMATVFTQAIALFAGMFVLFSGKKEIHIKLKHFNPDFTIIKKILKLGIPLSLEQSSRAVSSILMTVLVTSFGTVVLASYGIGMQLIGLIIIPSLSLSIANSTMIGQNIGAGKIDRAEKIAKISAWIGFVTLTFIGLLFFIFAKNLAGIFIADDIEVIKTSALFLRIVALTFGSIAAQMALFGALRASGNASITMKISIMSLIIQVGSAFVLSKYTSLGDLGIWMAFPISNIAGLIAVFIVFSRGNWKNRKIIETPEIHKRIEEECRIAECE